MAKIPHIPADTVALKPYFDQIIDQLYMAGADRNFNGTDAQNIRTLDCDAAFIGGFPIYPQQLCSYKEKQAIATGDSRVWTFGASALNGVSVFVNGSKVKSANYAITGVSAPPQFLNSNFEGSALAGWGTTASGTWGTPSTNPHSGFYCASLLTDGAYIYQNLTDLIAGAQYRISLWVRGDAGVTASIALQVFDGSGSVGNYSISPGFVPDLIWRRISWPYTVNSTNQLNFAILRSGAGGGAVVFDDLSVSGGYAPTTFTITFALGSQPPAGADVAAAGLMIG